MSAVKSDSRVALVLMAIREGYGVEDISHRHDIPLADVRTIVADLRKGGYLPGGKREKDRPPREARKPTGKAPLRARSGGIEVARADDDALLAAIWLRIKGHTAREIGRIQGRNPQTIRQATVAVMNADLAESGEPAGAVLKHYWGR